MGSTLKTDQILYIPHNIIYKDFLFIWSAIYQDVNGIQIAFNQGYDSRKTNLYFFYYFYMLNVYSSFTYVFVILHCLRHVIFLYRCIWTYTNICDGVFFAKIGNSLQPLTVFAESLILDVCTGSECLSGCFVLIEIINLLMQWWKDELKSDLLLLFDLLFY